MLKREIYSKDRLSQNLPFIAVIWPRFSTTLFFFRIQLFNSGVISYTSNVFPSMHEISATSLRERIINALAYLEMLDGFTGLSFLAQRNTALKRADITLASAVSELQKVAFTRYRL